MMIVSKPSSQDDWEAIPPQSQLYHRLYHHGLDSPMIVSPWSFRWVWMVVKEEDDHRLLRRLRGMASVVM